MFQLDWYDGSKQGKVIDKAISAYDLTKIEKVQFTFWAEHCLECAPPECYKSCEYYMQRIDGRCKRTEHGQELYPYKDAILNKGVVIKFRPWAKIETYIYNRYLTLEEYVNEETAYEKKVSKINKLGFLNYKGLFNSANYFFETRTKARTQSTPEETTSFIFELYSFYDKPYQMMIEAADLEWKVIARTSVCIEPGFNSYILDYKSIAPNNTNVVRFYPENSLEIEALIINAEFVKLKDSSSKMPAKKVKCVAWDLDNTLWTGILSETDDDKTLKLRDGVKQLIYELDKRGVIQTVVSKNDFNPAWSKIESLGLADFFLYPAINWGQKSSNLKSIAKELNINIDTFAMIDDSDFERREIAASLPQVRVFDENIISDLLSLPEFDLPITEEAIHRREMYQTEYKRKQIQATYSGDYLEFIRSCEMELKIGNLKQCEDENIYARCYELVSRTNQLNISGNKYTKSEFLHHYNADEKKHIYIQCADKYGSYGIVGYVSFDANDSKLIIDEFAVSCRVAQKHVEYTIISWIARKYDVSRQLEIKFVETGKNTPMFNCLSDIGFVYDGNLMKIDINRVSEDDGIIHTIEI
jgi:FkbH-like protein